MIASVISLRDYQKPTGEVARNSTSDFGFKTSQGLDAVSYGEESLSSAVLRRLDPDADLARFLDVVSTAIQEIESCEQLLRDEDNFGADDLFGAAKQPLTELYMFRDISDAIGLISLICIQAIDKTNAITESPGLLPAMRSALTKLYDTPRLSFDEAETLVAVIEDRIGSRITLPGYAEVTMELTGEANS